MSAFFPLSPSPSVAPAPAGTTASSATGESSALATCSVLSDYPVFIAQGADAASFLHGQLTNDVTGLTAEQARFAGYCTAKGRLLATMVVWPGASDDETPSVVGFMRQGVAEPVLKRLKMFVLRAKVAFVSADVTLCGVSALAAQHGALSEAAGGELPRTPWTRRDLPSGTWIAAPSADDRLRWWWAANESQLEASVAELRPLLTQGSPATWHAGDLAAGLPWIDTAVQDVFTPQAVNLDLAQGVSFTKGCYPGQEVVARSHYRGTIKRRMACGVVPPGASASDALAGLDVYSSARADEPCGRVVDSAVDGNITLLFETTLASLESGTLSLGAPDGPKITVQPLPYSLT